MAAGVGRSGALGAFLVHLWHLARPEIWMVSVVPTYVGWVLATGQLVPALEAWTGFWQTAVTQGATTDLFLATLGQAAVASADLLVALAVMGPLLGTATLFINDVHDLPGDRVNPRKQASPLLQGHLRRSTVRVLAYALAAAGLILAIWIGWTFGLLAAGAVGLAWAYSVPPVRLKTRPGGDVAVNAVGIGVIAALAGWSVARPLAGFPFELLPQGILVGIAVYVPTTLVDHQADLEVGYTTLATHLGPERAYRIGWWAWVGANLGAVLLAWNAWTIPRAMLPLLVVFCPLLLFEYHRLIGQADDAEAMVEGIVITSLTFLVVNACFGLMYTGLWRV